MSQFNLRYVPTLSVGEFILNGQRFNTQGAIINGNTTTRLTTEVILNDQTKNQALYANILALEGEVVGNVNPNLIVVDSRLNALESNVSILQNEMNIVEGNITVLQGNVVSLQSQINVLSGNVQLDEQTIAQLVANTQFLRAPYDGVVGNTSYFLNGLQMWSGSNESGNGLFVYKDGGNVGLNQIRLGVENDKTILIAGGTNTQLFPVSSGNVTIGSSDGNFNFNVGDRSQANFQSLSKTKINGLIDLKGQDNTALSIYTTTDLLPKKRLDIRGDDETRLFGPLITASGDDGGSINVSKDIRLEVPGGSSPGEINLQVGACDLNQVGKIKIGTEQGAVEAGFKEIYIGQSGPPNAIRKSSTFIGGDLYMPYGGIVPPNTGLWDLLLYQGLPTIYSGPTNAPVKTTVNPYFRSISTFAPDFTTNSFVQTSGTFSVSVGIGGIIQNCGAGGFSISCLGGAVGVTALLGGVFLTTAAGAIQMTTGAGAINMTTGAAPIQMETNIGDVLIKAGYAFDSTPQLSLGSIYLQARDYTYITPDKNVVVGAGIEPPYNAVIANTINNTFFGNLFITQGPIIGNVVNSNVFLTPNIKSSIVNPLVANLYYQGNIIGETGQAQASLFFSNGTVYSLSDIATVPYFGILIANGNIKGNLETTKFTFTNVDIPINANMYYQIAPVQFDANITNDRYAYGSWQSNAEIESNISILLTAYLEPGAPSFDKYLTVLGNASFQSDVECNSNIILQKDAFPLLQTVITNDSILTTGSITCDTLNYTTLNPPIVGGVNSIIAGTNITISPISGQGNVVINATIPAVGGVNSIIAGNGIEINPIGGQGNVTIQLAGSVIPPGGYLPINGGTMTGAIYQFPSGNLVANNTIKKYRPVTSYQPPFPSIGPPTFTGEQLCFFNGDNSPEQTGFTGWFPQNLIPGQPNVMTEEIEVSTAAKFYEFSGGNQGSSSFVNAMINKFKIGDHIKGGYFPYAAWDGGLIGSPQLYIYNYSPTTGKTVVLFKCALELSVFGPSSINFEALDFIYTGGQQDTGDDFNVAQIVASIDQGQGDPYITNNRNPANGYWEGYINLVSNQKSQFMALNVDSSQAVIYEFYPDTLLVHKLMSVGLTSGTYAAGENAVAGIFLNPQRIATTRLIYIYGRFDTVNLGSGPITVNNIFAYNIDTNTVSVLTTLTNDPLYSGNLPIGSNGRVNGCWVSQIIVDPDVRFSVYFWGAFTGPNQMGVATPPTGTNWAFNSIAITDNDNWSMGQNFRPVSEEYSNCQAGYCIADNASLTPDDTQFFLFVGNLNGNVKNTILGLTFDGALLNKFSDSFCFMNGDVGTSAINKVQNIQTVTGSNRVFFMGDWQGNAFNGNTNVACSSIAATSTINGNFYANGMYFNSFEVICGSNDSSFWIPNGEVIEATCIQTSNVNLNPVNYLIGTTGYSVGLNGGGVLLFNSNVISNPLALPTKEPILGSIPYSVLNIPEDYYDPNAVKLTSSLNNNNYWFSQTFDTTNPLIPPGAPTVNAINGAFFAVGNHEMTKIVFSGTDTDYNSVSFIAGDVEAGDKVWYWQSQVGAIDYFSGNVFYPNVTAIGNINDLIGPQGPQGNVGPQGPQGNLSINGTFTGDYIFWDAYLATPAWVTGNTQIKLGSQAGNTNQGTNSIAIGQFAGNLNQPNNSIILNATGSALNATYDNSLTIAPVRNPNVSYNNFLNYDDTTKEVVYNYFMLPVGNTNQRPSNVAVGMMRYNTTIAKPEIWNGTDWLHFTISGVPFQGGNQVVSDLYSLMFNMVGKADANPTFGGSLTINSVLVGSYDYTIRVGNQSVNAFSSIDWFTNSADSIASLICVDGDLTINTGVLFRPTQRKLFTCIYVAGNLTVTGGISMSARGANTSALAVQTADIRIINGTYSGVVNPQVPSSGGAGGSGVNGTGDGVLGVSGLNGSTGGGGGAGAYVGNSGSGSQGSSFSGGSGGGGSNSGAGNHNATAFGGIGGTGRNVNGGNQSSGGTGNPGGPSIDNNGNVNPAATGNTGTGGTLIIFVEGSLVGSGTIGCDGVNGLVFNSVIGPGGGSGGGSLTIICNNDASTTTRTAQGGNGGIGFPSPPYNQLGGAGGNGSVRLLTGL